MLRMLGIVVALLVLSGSLGVMQGAAESPTEPEVRSAYAAERNACEQRSGFATDRSDPASRIRFLACMENYGWGYYTLEQ